MDFKKIVRVGTSKTIGGRGYSIYCNIELKNGRLSISGVEGPLESGNCLGACGQIDMHEWNINKYAPGWSDELVKKFRQVWAKWHLNDFQAGTPEQMKYIEELKSTGWKYDYAEACKELKKVGLYEVPDPREGFEGQSYKYGSSWLKKELPIEVIRFLISLPDSDKQPAWV